MKAPRVNGKRTDPETGERQRFSSAILPAWARRSPQITELLPLLYLHGLSSGDFAPALEQFLGTGAGGDHRVRTRLRREVPEDRRRRDVLLEFYHYPAEHWIHLRTTNPIESTFATVRLRSKVTKGPGSRWRST